MRQICMCAILNPKISGSFYVATGVLGSSKIFQAPILKADFHKDLVMTYLGDTDSSK